MFFCLHFFVLIFLNIILYQMVFNLYKNVSNMFRHTQFKSNNIKRMLTNGSTFPKQIYDYFLILDFEATCDREKNPVPMEIIEFPVLKMNTNTMEIEDVFHRYVRPSINPKLSLFCTELTNILQETIDNANKFEYVFYEFREWMFEIGLVDIQEIPLKKFAFITYGDSDLKKILPRQCKACNLHVPYYLNHWIDVRKSYTSGLSTSWPSGQSQLMTELNLSSVGQSHSGINDAYDLARIVTELARRGHVFSINSR